jgi:hypothetical protein
MCTSHSSLQFSNFRLWFSSNLKHFNFVVFVAQARLFEEEQDEESYRRLRSREKRGMQAQKVFNYEKDSHENSHLVLDQRHLMVNWMIEVLLLVLANLDFS